MRTQAHLLLLVLGFAAACSGAPAPADPPPTEEPAVVPDAEPAPTPEPDTTTPEPEPEPAPAAPQAKSAFERYRGKAVVLTKVERDSITCKAANEGASLDDNRRACAAELVSQLKKPNTVVIVVDQIAAGCKTCIRLAGEVSEVGHEMPSHRVIFLAEEAGSVECVQNDPEVKGEDAQKSCYDRLRKEAGSLRAGVVVPEGIEQGQACKSCISIVGTGYVAKVLSN